MISSLKGFGSFGELSVEKFLACWRSRKHSNYRQGIMVSRFEGNFQMFIDTTRQIAETLYFSLNGVDALQGGDFRYVFCSIFGRIPYNFKSGVDLAAETFTG